MTKAAQTPAEFALELKLDRVPTRVVERATLFDHLAQLEMRQSVLP